MNYPPYFIAEPTKSDIEIERNEGRNVLSDVQLEKDIRGFLDTLFTTYTEGSDQELAYYTKGFDLDSLKGILVFKDVESVDIYDEGDRYKIHADVVMKEATSESEMVYPYSIELVQEDRRWLVVSFEHNY